MILDRTAGPHGELIGHMARANSQWKHADGQPVLCIFHGPHAYVSPTYYQSANVVPTWNYVTVHAYGKFAVDDNRDRQLEIVQRCVDFYEAGMPRPWSMDQVDADVIEGLLNAITAFTIPIERLEGKWKLNQNHDTERRRNVINALDAAGGEDGVKIADLMRQTLSNGLGDEA